MNITLTRSITPAHPHNAPNYNPLSKRHKAMTIDALTRFEGLTAHDMNYKSRQGRCSREDLQAWADASNPKLVSIQWDVKKILGGGVQGFDCYELVDRLLPDDSDH